MNQEVVKYKVYETGHFELQIYENGKHILRARKVIEKVSDVNGIQEFIRHLVDELEVLRECTRSDVW